MTLLVAALTGVSLVLLIWPTRSIGPVVRATRRRGVGRSGPWSPAAVGAVARGWLRRPVLLRRAPDPGVRDRELLAVAEALASALGAGLDLTAAHEVAVAAAPTAVRDLFVRAGARGPADAWAEVGHDSEVARAVARALAVSGAIGSPAREAVRRAVAAGRDRRSQAGSVDAAVAGARATARLLAALPLAGPLVVLALGLDPVATYAHPLTLLSCALGAGLCGVGQLWVARQVDVARREPVAE
ncbi:hypothetical protein [Arsenicicoccus dermatophilus]|uniref:hypothetical protein n=1 Tax=Arsenicicoccus dermatophilus TaxID=1076331 RepID=UPI001F4CACC6|nr:hypothetical protein [Arsenicicoccus dermatophilus]MCH8613952.1 hypothetical protein [Arsenicicoccus dermatophilus]